MGELLQSFAYSSTLIHSSFLGWDLQNLGVHNTDMSLAMDQEGNYYNSVPLFSSSLEPDFSTGYLEDALLENKRRRRRHDDLMNSDGDDKPKISNDLGLQCSFCWKNSRCECEMSENFSCISQITHGVSDEPMSAAMSNIWERKTPEEVASDTDQQPLDSSTSSYNKDPPTSNSIFSKDMSLSDTKRRKKTREKRKRRVVYPFAVVKPGGNEGDITINDINQKILMPPTRPVRHPVGDFACRPCVSADGPGLSGKAVVALTRIHTHGRRGTITIIRTRG